jgi:lysozyme family protein
MPVGGFDKALGRTFAEEGGYNSKDANGVPVNFGINQAAHPDVDVSKITRDQAAAIYKRDYWDKIGGDQLAQTNPALAHVAFDTAVVAGVPRAQQFLQQSGGDPNKFMDLRDAYLHHLIGTDPGTYAKYARVWQSRDDHLRADIGAASRSGESLEASANPAPQEQKEKVFNHILDMDLDPETREYALGRASRYYSEIEASQAVDRETLSRTIPDLIAAKEAGVDNITVPFDRAASVFSPAKVAAWREEVEVADQVGAAMRGLRWASPEDVDGFRQNIESGEGIASASIKARRGMASTGPGVAGVRPDPDEEQAAQFRLRVALSRRFEAQIAQRDAVLNGQNADPAAYAAAEPNVARAVKGLSTNTPAAYQAYATATLGVQSHLGVSQPRVLTKEQAEKFASRWANPDANGGATAVAKEIEQQAALWGDHWPQVYREIAPRTSDVIRIIGAGVQGTAAKELLEAQGVSEDELLKQADDPETKKADVSKAVTDALKPFATTLTGSQRAQTLRDAENVAERLALLRLAGSQGNANAAAKSAVTDLIDYKYDYRGTFRIPKSAGVTPNTIEAGAAEAKAELGNGSLLAPPDSDSGPLALATNVSQSDPNLPENYRARETAEGLRNNGIWVTSPREDGLVLMRPDGYPARRPDGGPVSLTWGQLRTLGVRKTAVANLMIQNLPPPLVVSP